jgi:hypothetical protein
MFIENPNDRHPNFSVPVVPKLPDNYRHPTDPNPVVATCGECGMCWRRVMMYSCGNDRCPMQPKVTT